ncbi:MAG TPA: hypothetical protein VGP72_29230 [Planctomycetota bacterium]|jgi:hypothetical protein
MGEADNILAAAAAHLGAALTCRGDMSLLEKPRRCLLVSRGERTPQPDTPCIRSLVKETQKLAAADEVLVCGAGRTAFDAALWTCSQSGGAAIIVLTAAPGAKDSWRELIPQRHLLVWPLAGTEARPTSPPEFGPHWRDLLMGQLSNRATAIHVRRSGHMAEVSAALVARGCKVDDPPQMPAAPTPRMEPEPTVLGSGSLQIPEGWEFLTHYTREPDGQWPGESRSDYLRWLCSGAPFEPRDGFAALCRILKEQRLRACGRLMPQSTPMVCFTARRPDEVLALRRWRRGLLRWTFTSHGLAVRTSALELLGARPVLYASEKELRGVPPETRRFMQPHHTGRQDWAAEAEWRVAGDVDLTRVAKSEMLAVLSSAAEADHIQSDFGVTSIIIPPASTRGIR